MSLSNLQEVMENDPIPPSYSMLTPNTIASTSPHQRPFYSISPPDSCPVPASPYRSSSLSPLPCSNPVFPSPSPNRRNGSQPLPFASKLSPRPSPRPSPRSAPLRTPTPSTPSMQPTLPPKPPTQCIQGHVFELATDYAGSRVLQQLVDAASPATLRDLLREVQLQLGQLMAHPVGSLFFQRLLERGDDALRDSIVGAGCDADT